jgi:hypothetical protein
MAAWPSVRGTFLCAGDEHCRRLRVTGTFASVGPDKPLVRGVTYGALAPNQTATRIPIRGPLVLRVIAAV